MSKKTYKNEIAESVLREFPNASTMALSRILTERYPIEWKNVDSARAIIRYLRGEISKSKTPMQVRTEIEKKQFMKKNFELPETDYAEIEPFIVRNKRILVLNDIHIPYQDNNSLRLAIDYGIENEMDAIYLNGDIMDVYQASRFIRDRRLRDLAGELELTRNFLKELQKFGVPIYYKIGNHEERWENFLRLSAPELLGISEFELKNVLRFREYGVTEVKGKQLAYAGKLALLHGHEFGHSVFSPVNPARGLYMRSKESSVIGHHHQTSEHTEKSLSGDVVTTWSIGCLCGLSPEYLPFNKWNHGFAFVEVDIDRNYKVHNKRIINGSIV